MERRPYRNCIYSTAGSKQLLSQSRPCNTDLQRRTNFPTFSSAREMEIGIRTYPVQSRRREKSSIVVPRRCALMLTGFSCQGARIIRIGRVRAKLVEVDTYSVLVGR